MSARDDSGPAFPICDLSQNTSTGETTAHQSINSGMTLRDYFAAKAMPMLAAEFYSHRQELTNGTVPELAARVAYQYADAMLKERAK